MSICVHVEQETTKTTRVCFAHETEGVLRVGRDELTGEAFRRGATPVVLAEAAQEVGVAELFSGHFAYVSQWNMVSHWDPAFSACSPF